MTLTAALGAAAGLLLGCALAIPLAENRLKTYMERVAVQDDASLTEARTLLDTLGHSANPACSDTDLSNLRDLVFGSDYLKDAGRVRAGRIECSATAGRPARPIAEFKAGKAQADGSVIYSNLAPARDQSLRRTGIQRGNVFVVFGSHLPELGGRLPIRSAIEPYPAATPATSEASSDPASDEVARRGSSLVATHCSAIMSNCVIASMDVDDARRGESTVIGATAVAGGIAGVFLGIALCSIHRRSLSLPQQLKNALAREQVHLAYQPIVNLATGKIVGAEALARWTRPDGVSVSPGDFIKTAEDHGFIVGSLGFARTESGETPSWAAGFGAKARDAVATDRAPQRSRVINSVAPSIATLVSIHAVAHTQDGSRKSPAIVSASDWPRSIRNRTRMSYTELSAT